MRGLWAVLKDAWNTYLDHDGSLHSGALAFYALLSVAPLAVIAVGVAGFFLGEVTATETFDAQVETWLGDTKAASFIEELVAKQEQIVGSGIALYLSGAFVVWAGLRVFLMLRASLNHVWGIRVATPLGFRGLRGRVLLRRLASIAMLPVVGASIVVLAVLKATLSAGEEDVSRIPFALQLLETASSIALVAVLVALGYKLLPDARIHWRDALVGGLATSVLASIGAYLIGLYLAYVGPASLYGAAGSLVVLLLWVYYMAQIFFFGANVTAAWAKHHGHGIEPLPHAMRLVLADETAPGP